METGDAPHGQHDHRTTEPIVRELLASLGLPARGLAWIESYSHSAWATDEVVVRYRIIGPCGRLTHEAAVAARLPPAALYPEVVASGQRGKDDWLVTARIPGCPVVAVWPRLSQSLRERATHEAATALRAIHGAPALDLQPPCLFGGAPVVARSEFIDTLIGVVDAEIPRGDETTARQCVALLENYRSAIDDEPTVMAHHDFSFDQCIWRDGHVVGLVDLEMAHAEAPDWDLPNLLAFCAGPYAAAPDVNTASDPGQFAEVPRWFRDAYPEAFAHPQLVARLRVYDLMYDLAQNRPPDLLAHMRDVLERGPHYEALLAR